MSIERIDVVDQPPAGAALFIWTRGSSEPVVMRFDERATAIAYVRDIWEKRQRQQQRDDED